MQCSSQAPLHPDTKKYLMNMKLYFVRLFFPSDVGCFQQFDNKTDQSPCNDFIQISNSVLSVKHYKRIKATLLSSSAPQRN